MKAIELSVVSPALNATCAARPSDVAHVHAWPQGSLVILKRGDYLRGFEECTRKRRSTLPGLSLH